MTILTTHAKTDYSLVELYMTEQEKKFTNVSRETLEGVEKK